MQLSVSRNRSIRQQSSSGHSRAAQSIKQRLLLHQCCWFLLPPPLTPATVTTGAAAIHATTAAATGSALLLLLPLHTTTVAASSLYSRALVVLQHERDLQYNTARNISRRTLREHELQQHHSHGWRLCASSPQGSLAATTSAVISTFWHLHPAPRCYYSAG